MDKDQQKVYALILNYNSANESIALYGELTDQHYENIEILVIDNNSKEKDSLPLRENIAEEKLIFNKQNLGFAAGNNVGIAKALEDNADYIWILNPDVRLKKDSLSILVETLEEDKSLAAVGPRILHRKSPGKIFSDGERMNMDEKATTFHKNHNLEVQALSTGIDYDIDYIAGSSILLNANAIKEIGSFPEEYFLYFEETDWCFKAHQNNWKLAINTNSIVYNLTSEKSSLFHYYFMRNKLIFCKKYHPDFSSVRNYQVKALFKEIVSRFRGNYFKPYFNQRLRGLVSGLIKTSL